MIRRMDAGDKTAPGNDRSRNSQAFELCCFNIFLRFPRGESCSSPVRKRINEFSTAC
jgi:hypothetical protein